MNSSNYTQTLYIVNNQNTQLKSRLEKLIAEYRIPYFMLNLLKSLSARDEIYNETESIHYRLSTELMTQKDDLLEMINPALTLNALITLNSSHFQRQTKASEFINIFKSINIVMKEKDAERDYTIRYAQYIGAQATSTAPAENKPAGHDLDKAAGETCNSTTYNKYHRYAMNLENARYSNKICPTHNALTKEIIFDETLLAKLLVLDSDDTKTT